MSRGLAAVPVAGNLRSISASGRIADPQKPAASNRTIYVLAPRIPSARTRPAPATANQHPHARPDPPPDRNERQAPPPALLWRALRRRSSGPRRTRCPPGDPNPTCANRTRECGFRRRAGAPPGRLVCPPTAGLTTTLARAESTVLAGNRPGRPNGHASARPVSLTSPPQSSASQPAASPLAGDG